LIFRKNIFINLSLSLESLMLETRGRKIFRSPLPLDQSSKTRDLSNSKVQLQNFPGGGSSIADAETHKTPSVPLQPLGNSSIADAETHKIPSLPLQSLGNSSIADIETLEVFTFRPDPSNSINRGPASAPKKARRGRAPVSKRKKALLMALAIGMLVPSFIVIFEIINAISLYRQVQDGIAHIQKIETIFHGSSSGGLTQYFDTHNLLQAQAEIDAAHADFVSLSDKLDHDATIGLLSNLWPTQVSTLRALGHIANTGTSAAQILIKMAIDIAPSIAPAFQKSLSHLSADYPTSARIAIERYAYEFGKQVDGVIMFTPALIKQVLHVTGPIIIPAYNETISEQNLEDRLHYYQLNNSGIRHEEIVEHVDDPQVARKLFTQRVTSTLISTVTHLPVNKLLPMVNEMLHSMKSKDLQIYVTNPQLESLIAKYGSTASLDRSTSHDGLFIVQSNLSASKASQYVTTAIQDRITLDAQGGATHHLQMTLDYQQKGDVYGFDTYYDYVRVYVPVNSQLLAGNGFDQYHKPYCGDAKSGYFLCQPDVYGDGSLLCSTPVELGYATSYLNDPYTGTDHPLDITGPPQNLQSDEAGRAMFGGWVVIPKNCVMKVTLSWYVPPTSQHLYSLLLQAQASVYAPLDLTVQPAQKTCVPADGNSLHFSDVMNGGDMTFTVERQKSKCFLISK
jgi:Protein of unknown function (DUF4012)